MNIDNNLIKVLLALANIIGMLTILAFDDVMVKIISIILIIISSYILGAIKLMDIIEVDIT